MQYTGISMRRKIYDIHVSIASIDLCVLLEMARLRQKIARKKKKKKKKKNFNV